MSTGLLAFNTFCLEKPQPGLRYPNAGKFRHKANAFIKASIFWHNILLHCGFHLEAAFASTRRVGAARRIIPVEHLPLQLAIELHNGETICCPFKVLDG